MRRAAEAGYKVNLIFVGLDDVAMSAARVHAHVHRGGHNVSKDAIFCRYGHSIEALPKALSIAHLAWVFDNSDSLRRLLLKRVYGGDRG